MKGTVGKLILRGIIVSIVLVVFLPLVGMSTHIPQAQADVWVPNVTCFQNCDHVEPPPISDCNNDGALNTKTIYDSRNVAIGELNLFHDQSACISFWAGLEDINNPDNKCFTITSLEVKETNDDQSAQGAVDSIPHTMCSPGKWESTKMNGWYLDGNLYFDYAASTVTDEYGHTNIQTSTVTEACQYIIQEIEELCSSN